MLKNNRVLILGSCGFIGSYLVSWLRAQNYFVVGIDMANNADPTLELRKPDRLYQLILPDKGFGEILKEFKPSAIINASGPASVVNSFLDPTTDFNGSANLCFSTLDAIRRELPECKYLLLSSAAVYGNPTTLPVTESATLNPISPYGYHKMICEELMKEFFDIYKIKTGVVRIFSAYGPGLRKQILWDIYQKAITEQQVYLFGTGEETRDFIFIQDIVRAIQVILENTDFNWDVFNIASGSEVSINKLSRLLMAALNMGDKEIIFSGETKVGDPIRWRADIEKVKKLGFYPKISLEQGISEYAKWVIEKGKNNDG